MPAMTNQHHKEALEGMLDGVTAELKTLGIHNPDNESDWVATPPADTGEADVNDVADSAEEWGEKTATLAVLETKWNDIRRALAKLEAGTYGVCEISGEQIEEERLLANPTARTCIAHREEEASLPK